MSATDEQFSRAWYAYFDSQGEDTPASARAGRKMLATLDAHGCIPKPQGLNLLQEVTLRLMCASPDKQFFEVVNAAEAILALGEPQ